MTQFRFVFLFIIFGLFSVGFSKTLKIDYIDPLGNKWNRWIIIDEQDQRNILSVLENPVKETDQRFATQVVVKKSIFAKSQLNEIEQQINYYKSLKDLSTRTVSYYKDLQLGSHDKTPKPLWVPIKNTWTVDDENKYAQWIKTNASEEMTLGAGLKFDCADYGLLNRWIFAHDNKLPVANALSGSGKLFGHFSESKNWSYLPTHADWKKDERFKTAMRYLFDSTYTHSIFNDLYPTKVSKEYITPGSIILTLRSGHTGHTQVVYEVGQQDYCGTECISVLYGNEPARDYAYKAQADLTNHNEKNGGFLRWRWPQLKNGRWQLTAKNLMPGYSLEQYSQPELDYSEFQVYVSESLGFKVAPYEKAWSIADSLYNSLYLRASNTAVGVMFCHYHYCDPQGALYDEYSTPSKDKRFRERRDYFLKLFSNLTAIEQDKLKKDYDYSFMPGLDFIQVSNYIFNANDISNKMSSDPSLDYAHRWGLESLDEFNMLKVQFSLFAQSWEFRGKLVSTALHYCRNSDGTIKCNPNAEEIKQLSTAKFDSSLKIIYADVKKMYENLTVDQKKMITLMAQKYYAGTGCTWNQNSYCWMSDYLLSEKDLVNRITSDPTHSYESRMGLK